MMKEKKYLISKFVNNSIKECDRKRILFELLDENKKGIDRFNHSIEKYISIDNMAKKDINCICKIVYESSNDCILYIDSFNKRGVILRRNEVIEKLNNFYLACLVIIDENNAIIKEEGNSNYYYFTY